MQLNDIQTSKDIEAVKKAKSVRIKRFKHHDKIFLELNDFTLTMKTKKGKHLENLHPELQKAIKEKCDHISDPIG